MDEESLTRRADEIRARYREGIVWAPDWPRVGDPCLGYERAPDCPESDEQGPEYGRVYCTRDRGHPMPHVADGLATIVHVWTDAGPVPFRLTLSGYAATMPEPTAEAIRSIAEMNPDRTRELLAFLFDRGPMPGRAE